MCIFYLRLDNYLHILLLSKIIQKFYFGQFSYRWVQDKYPVILQIRIVFVFVFSIGYWSSMVFRCSLFFFRCCCQLSFSFIELCLRRNLVFHRLCFWGLVLLPPTMYPIKIIIIKIHMKRKEYGKLVYHQKYNLPPLRLIFIKVVQNNDFGSQ